MRSAIRRLCMDKYSYLTPRRRAWRKLKDRFGIMEGADIPFILRGVHAFLFPDRHIVSACRNGYPQWNWVNDTLEIREGVRCTMEYVDDIIDGMEAGG